MDYIEQFKRNYGHLSEESLSAIINRYQENSPHHIAAAQLLDELRAKAT